MLGSFFKLMNCRQLYPPAHLLGKIHVYVHVSKTLPAPTLTCPTHLQAWGEHHPAVNRSVQRFNYTACPSQQPLEGLFHAEHTGRPRTFSPSLPHCPGTHLLPYSVLTSTTMILPFHLLTHFTQTPWLSTFLNLYNEGKQPARPKTHKPQC